MADQDVIQGLMQVLPGFEGDIPYMYLDIAGLVTVGIGHMIPNLSWAQQIPFVARSTAAPASADDIQSDFQAVAVAAKGQPASAYERITSLNLPDGWAVQDASQRLQNEYLPPLKMQYPGYDGYPQPAQEALLDMIYNLARAGWPSLYTLRLRCWPDNGRSRRNRVIARASSKRVTIGRRSSSWQPPHRHEIKRKMQPPMNADKDDPGDSVLLPRGSACSERALAGLLFLIFDF